MFHDAVAKLIDGNRESLAREGRLRPSLLPQLTPPALRAFQQEVLTTRSDGADTYAGTVGDTTRVVKVYGKQFLAATTRVPELLALLARGMSLVDDACLTERAHLCLPEAFALDRERDELLITFPMLPYACSDVAISPAQTATIISAAARGLGALRTAGYIHADVSAANLRFASLTPTSATWIDFDLLYRIGDDEYAAGLSQRGILIGTPRYWPERWLVDVVLQGEPMKWDRIDFSTLAYLLAELAGGYHPPPDAGPYTLTAERATLVLPARRRTGLRRVAGLQYVFARLIDETTGYATMDEVCADLATVQAGAGAVLAHCREHRSAWRRTLAAAREAQRRQAQTS